MEDKKCKVCESVMVAKNGVSAKNNKPWSGWFCPDRDCKGDPIWEASSPHKGGPSVSDLQKEFTMIQERFDMNDERWDKLSEFLVEEFAKLAEKK